MQIGYMCICVYKEEIYVDWVHVYLGGGICGLGTCVFVFIIEEGYMDWVHVYLCL